MVRGRCSLDALSVWDGVDGGEEDVDADDEKRMLTTGLGDDDGGQARLQKDWRVAEYRSAAVRVHIDMASGEDAGQGWWGRYEGAGWFAGWGRKDEHGPGVQPSTLAGVERSPQHGEVSVDRPIISSQIEDIRKTLKTQNDCRPSPSQWFGAVVPG
jgi:hypothetical protein